MMAHTPILLIGAGALGASILKGISLSGHIDLRDTMVCEINPSDEVKALGVILNPSESVIAKTKTVIFAVKPQMWQAVAQDYCGIICPQANLISVMAGVQCGTISQKFANPDIVRVMPTTGVSTAKGVASIFAKTEEGRGAAHFIFDQIATTVDLYEEDLIDAATAVSGSGPAYVYAFVRALEAAANQTGLKPKEARILARATLISAAHLLDSEGAEPEDLIKRVMSPGGTTEAAIKVLCGENGIDSILEKTVMAAFIRAKQLA